MQKQSFGLGLFSLTALRRTADLQGMLSAKTADLAPVVPVIALVELNDSNQPKVVTCADRWEDCSWQSRAHQHSEPWAELLLHGRGLA